jgi:uncharacterized protein (DUF58 family)
MWMSQRWSGLSDPVRQRWLRWLDARAPQSDQLTLTQRNIYIVPIKAGLAYAAVTLILLLAAINEQLNLAYALAFMLGGVGLSAMSSTHANLRGLTLSLQQPGRAHAGEALAVKIRLQAVPRPGMSAWLGRWAGGTKRRCALTLGGGAAPALVVDVPPGEPAELMMQLPALQRGWQTLPRWRLATTYPLGLFQAWAYWRAATPALVWPALEAHAPALPGHVNEAPQATKAHQQLPETADELRNWRRGDHPRDVAWRKSATRMTSGQPPVVRERTPKAQAVPRWITWEATQGLDTEARLRRLAAWLVRAEHEAQQGGQAYGLSLPGVRREPLLGQAHLHRCLDDLAMWGLDKPPSTPPTSGRTEPWAR